MHRPSKMFMTHRATRLLLFVVILIAVSEGLHSSFASSGAQAAFDFAVSLNGYSLSVAPNHAGYVQVTVSLVSGSPQNVSLTSVVSPADGQLSTSFAQSSGIPSFVTTLVVNALAASPGTQYSVLVSGSANGLTREAPPLTVTITCSPGTCSTLTTAAVGGGTIAPSCPSGCSEQIGQEVNVTAAPSTGWTFSGWNVTGAACVNGATSNPCVFTMPNGPVSVNGNFAQYQTLYTTYTGDGGISPSCPTGCQVPIGSAVSLVATPSPGWQINGYQLTNGVSCGVGLGYTCNFTMPDFPVSFQVTFAPITTTTQTTVTASSTIQTSTTNTVFSGSTSTSTFTTSTLSLTQTGSTQTTMLYSTSVSTATQTQANLLTLFSTTSINTVSATLSLADPVLELGLGGIILFSVALIGINVARRSPRGGLIVCSRCGFKNPSRSKFCVGCGESLKGP